MQSIYPRLCPVADADADADAEAEAEAEVRPSSFATILPCLRCVAPRRPAQHESATWGMESNEIEGMSGEVKMNG